MMDTNKLNRIIASFWQRKKRDPRYHNGYCSEFAVSLQNFLGTGQIHMVGGLWHTALKYGNSYCDVRGCYPISEFISKNPIGLSASGVRPAKQKEIDHINQLLNHDIVADIVAGLKQSKKEIK